MDCTTGRRLDEVAHIRQSVRKILTTPVGSRIKRREFGSLIPDLIDHPASPANRLRLMSATIMAIIRWEPRISVRSVHIVAGADGSTAIDMVATRRRGPRAGTDISILTAVR